MRFVLSRELVDQIVFAMENQEIEFVLDLQTMDILPADEQIDQPTRLVPLPPWQSVDGYNLMERFAGTLNNPVYGDRLRAILASGRGVFRQFKDAIKERPDFERLWYRFKNREMQNLVVEWYNDTCEFLGLDPEEPEFSGTEDLVLSDFGIQACDGPLSAELIDYVAGREQIAVREVFADQPEDYRDHLIRRYSGDRGSGDPNDSTLLLLAEGPGVQRAGFLHARHRTLQSGRRVATVAHLYVEPEFRGLGIATALINDYLSQARSRGISRILIELPGSGEVVRGVLETSGFDSLGVTMDIDVQQWGRSVR